MAHAVSIINSTRGLIRRTGIWPDLSRLAVLVLGSLGLALGLYAVNPYSPPLEVSCALSAHLPAAVGREFRSLSARGAIAMVSSNQKAVLVDVRTTEAYNESHAPGARSLPWHGLSDMCPDFNAKISQGSTLILYTYTAESPLAVQMVDNLTKCGYPHIFIIHDGFEEWRAGGLPLEAGPDKGAK